MSGREKPVADAVFSHQEALAFIGDFLTLFERVSASFLREGKRYITIAFSCTGGRHRSVAVAEEVQRRLKEQKVQVHLQHRDVDRT